MLKKWILSYGSIWMSKEIERKMGGGEKGK